MKSAFGFLTLMVGLFCAVFAGSVAAQPDVAAYNRGVTAIRGLRSIHRDASDRHVLSFGGLQGSWLRLFAKR